MGYKIAKKKAKKTDLFLISYYTRRGFEALYMKIVTTGTIKDFESDCDMVSNEDRLKMIESARFELIN